MEEEQIKIFADSLWDYMLEKKLKQYLSDSVCYYMATVVSPASNGTIVVQRPFDNPVTLPCGANAEGLNVGETCAVLVFGDFSNQIVIGDIANLQDKLTFDQTPTEGSQNPVTSGGVFDAEQNLRESIGIVENGTSATHNITAGEYVVWQGSLYTASTNIAIGTVLSTSNLTAVADGGLNALSDAIDDTAVCKVLGTFSTLAELGTLLDTELAAVGSDGTELIRVQAGASIYPFVNSYAYLGRLLRSSLSYASAALYPTGPNARPVYCKRSQTYGWEFEPIATDADICNPNLLDNWYFIGGGSQQGNQKFPINERGQTSYALGTSYSYFINRWKGYRGTVTLESDHINYTTTESVAAYKRIFQLTGFSIASGTTLTLSMVARVNSVNGWAVLRPTNNGAGITGASGLQLKASEDYQLISYTFTTGADTTNLGADIIVNSVATATLNIDIKAIKLELGSTQTLAHQESGEWILNELPNYEEQLIRCKSFTADTSDTYANDPVVFEGGLQTWEAQIYDYETSLSQTVTTSYWYKIGKLCVAYGRGFPALTIGTMFQIRNVPFNNIIGGGLFWFEITGQGGSTTVQQTFNGNVYFRPNIKGTFPEDRNASFWLIGYS